MELFIGLLSLVGFIICMSLFIYGTIRYRRLTIVSRLDRIKSDVAEEIDIEPLSRPFLERAIIPIFISIGDFFMRLTPSRISSSIDERMWMAGYTDKNRINQFFTIQSIWLIALPVIMGVFAYVLNIAYGRMLFLIIFTIIFSTIYPSVRLNSRINARKDQIKRDLPNAIDLLVVSVEAGLGFDMALEKVTQKMSGPLVQEFAYTLNEIRMGKPRVAALRGMSTRTKIEELSSFIGSIIQADQLGVSIGNILRIQSDAMRVKRRQSIEEASMKAPVKMLFPLVFFILPSIFVVILGPAIINLMRIFAGMR